MPEKIISHAGNKNWYDNYDAAFICEGDFVEGLKLTESNINNIKYGTLMEHEHPNIRCYDCEKHKKFISILVEQPEHKKQLDEYKKQLDKEKKERGVK